MSSCTARGQVYVVRIFQPFLHLLLRLRYPVSMPEDVARDLGLNISNFLTFSQFIAYLTDPSHRLTKLFRFMPREQAEGVFRSALRREIFQQNSLFSYHFKGGWMEFILHFDEQSRLRRLYIRHKALKEIHEVSLAKEFGPQGPQSCRVPAAREHTHPS